MKTIKSLVIALVMLSIFDPSHISGFSLQQFDYQVKDSIRHFEELLDSLRINLKIPAISAAVIKNNEIIWAKGFFIRVTLPLLVGAAIIEAALMIHLGDKR